MRHAASTADDAPGQDSFLDIVANMVGILIILVMVVGVRAGQSRRAKMAAASAEDLQQHARQQARATALLADVRQLGGNALEIQQEIAARKQERQQWETLLLVGTQALARQRRSLDAAAQAEFDLQRRLETARKQLDEITHEQVSLAGEKAAPIRIENRPTPLSKTVLGQEYHFQLRGGRVVSIPLEALLSRFKSAAQHRMWKLADRSEITDTVGPIGGFRLRYQLERIDIPRRVQLETGRGGSIVRLVRWELIPVSSNLGETVQEALADGSRFRRALPRNSRSGATITLWTYPDSFGTLRSLQENLRTGGYLVAVRPLPAGIPIGGSPEGSRSAAE